MMARASIFDGEFADYLIGWEDRTLEIRCVFCVCEQRSWLAFVPLGGRVVGVGRVSAFGGCLGTITAKRLG